MIWHGKNFRGFLHHALQVLFDNTGTTLSSTNVEDAIKEVNSNLYDRIVYHESNSTPIDTNNHIYSTNVSANDYYLIGADTLVDTNVKVETFIQGTVYCYQLYEVPTNALISSNYPYLVYSTFIKRSGLKQI